MILFITYVFNIDDWCISFPVIYHFQPFNLMHKCLYVLLQESLPILNA